MPVTPLHAGPGVLVKAAAGRHLSLTLFALTQVTMDVEVIARLALGSTRLHGYANTLLGATAVLVVTVPPGRFLGEWLLRWWNDHLGPDLAGWLTVRADIPWLAAWTGGAMGVYTHFVLDAIMHADARPWAPFSDANSFVGLVSIDALNGLCAMTLLLGALAIGVAALVRRRRSGSGGPLI